MPLDDKKDGTSHHMSAQEHWNGAGSTKEQERNVKHETQKTDNQYD